MNLRIALFLTLAAWATEAFPAGSKPRLLCYLSPVDGYWQVVERNLDGTGRKVLTHSPFDKKDPVFHPDGKHIYFSGTNAGVFRIALRDGKEETVPMPIVGARGIKFSSDGKRTLFYRARTDVNDQSEIWTGDANFQNCVRIIYRPGLQRYPDGGRDFRNIIYLSGRAVTGHDIWIYQVQNDKHVQVTNDLAAEGAPVISPSGTLAVFPSAPLGVYNIYLLDLRETTPRLLFPCENTLLDLDWIDDESLVCVIMKTTGEPQLGRVSIKNKTLEELPWKEDNGLRYPSVYKP